MLNTMVVSQLLDGRSQVGIVLAVFLGFYIKNRFFPAKKLGPKVTSPFIQDTRTPSTPLETDQEKRNLVLKKVFTKELATEHQWDAIVIGSGIGGLSSAAILSKAGMKVLVLEKHGKCGGGCHIFKAEGYEFDVGIHYIGGFNRPTLHKTLLEQISDGQIKWADLDKNFDVLVMDAMSPSQRQYEIPSGRGAWKKQLIERFPEEKQAIERFFDMVSRASRNSKAYIMVKMLPVWVASFADRLGLFNLWGDFFTLGKRSLKETVEELTKNDDLRLLLTYCWGCYGTPPSEASFALHSLLIDHYEQGASYPIGGASEIPYRIVPVIERAGGRVRMKAPVSEILVEHGQVYGVRVGKPGSTVDIHAPIVISDAGIHNTFIKLLPEHAAKLSPTYPLATSLKPGIGCLSVFIGLRGTTAELGLKSQNIWAFTGTDPETSFEKFNKLDLQDALYKPYPFYFIGFPSAKDPSWESRYHGRSTVTVVSFAPYSWFQAWAEKSVKKRGEEYDSLKNALGQQLVDQVIHLYPQLKDAVDYFCVGTPNTMEHYLSTQDGAVYGLDHHKERFLPEQASRLRPKSGIQGLYLSGQDITSAGFTSSLMSGLMCASTVLDTNLLTDLVKLHQKTKGFSPHEKRH